MKLGTHKAAPKKKYLHLRVTEAEWDAWHAHAAADHRTISDFVRLKINEWVSGIQPVAKKKGAR